MKIASTVNLLCETGNVFLYDAYSYGGRGLAQVIVRDKAKILLICLLKYTSCKQKA